MLYSIETKGYYSPSHKNIPLDAVELTPEQYRSFLIGQAQGKVIANDGAGNLVLIDPAPSINELANEARADRDAKLADTGWLIERHRDQQDAQSPTTLSNDQYQAVLAYRQALRDIPAQAGFPETIIQPDLPAFLVKRS